MKNIFQLSIILIGLALLIMSCRKDKIQASNPELTAIDLPIPKTENSEMRMKIARWLAHAKRRAVSITSYRQK